MRTSTFFIVVFSALLLVLFLLTRKCSHSESNKGGFGCSRDTITPPDTTKSYTWDDCANFKEGYEKALKNYVVETGTKFKLVINNPFGSYARETSTEEVLGRFIDPDKNMIEIILSKSNPKVIKSYSVREYITNKIARPKETVDISWDSIVIVHITMVGKDSLIGKAEFVQNYTRADEKRIKGPDGEVKLKGDKIYYQDRVKKSIEFMIVKGSCENPNNVSFTCCHIKFGSIKVEELLN